MITMLFGFSQGVEVEGPTIPVLTTSVCGHNCEQALIPARANSEADQSSFFSFEILAQRRHHARNRCVDGKRGDAPNTLCLSVGSGVRVFISKSDLSIPCRCASKVSEPLV